LAAAQTAHLLLPQPHKPNLQAKAKEPFFCQRTDINSYFATMFLTMQGASRDALNKEEAEA